MSDTPGHAAERPDGLRAIAEGIVAPRSTFTIESIQECFRIAANRIEKLERDLTRARDHDESVCTALESRGEMLEATKQELVEATRLLVHSFRFLGNEIKRKPLNESAMDGTQSLSREIATFLDKAKATLK